MPNSNCPFGTKLQRYWDRRYHYFSRFDDGICIDAEGLHSVTPENAALAQTQLVPDANVILDGFCGVGGQTIAYAQAGKKVIAVDKSATRLAMAKQNARIYDVADNITFIHGDFFEIAANVSADLVTLDPPWGWPRSQNMHSFSLKHLQPDGNQLLQFTMQHFSTIILRVPAIFDLSELDRSGIHYLTHKDMLQDEVISLSVLIRTVR